jgi:hypothetical protein
LIREVDWHNNYFSILLFHLKNFYVMPNPKTDKEGFSTLNADEERDQAAKGGPMTGPGQADDKHAVPAPYDDDTQTQLAAKSTKKKEKKDTETGTS